MEASANLPKNKQARLEKELGLGEKSGAELNFNELARATEHSQALAISPRFLP
jgi:hypothetical protein